MADPKVRTTALGERIIRPFVDFMNTEASSGVLLMAATALALLWANLSDSYFHFWQTRASLSLGSFVLEKPLLLWINDGLMAVFFFLVGLEIKRECLIGELSSPRKAALPIVAALGGMVVPGAIYAALNAGGQGSRGWGIPMATDIAFALGVLALLGSRVPLSLKVFLAAVAIVDDIGAVLVIAVFYSEGIRWDMLLGGCGIVAMLGVFNRLGIRNLAMYVLPGIVLWYFFLKSGVHATVAGVLLAITIPTRVRLVPGEFAARVEMAVQGFKKAEGGDPTLMTEDQQSWVHRMERACERVQMPLQRIEHALKPIVVFGIMPLFALANAGVAVDASAIQRLGEPIGIGIVLGLLLGKPIGILLASWLAIKLGMAKLPARVGWPQLAGVGILAGVGFTMSLFVTELAFTEPENIRNAKMAILFASITAGLVGYVLLRNSARRNRAILAQST